MRALRITGKVVGWILLSVLLLVVAALLTVVVVGRTDWGHRKLLAIALPEIQKQLAGHLQIGAVDGDLTHGLVLRDVELDDVEHKPAVRMKALTVHYNLLGLARHTIDLTEVKAEEAWVHARVLRDGKLNLSELAKPSDKKEEDTKKSSSGYKIRLGKVWAELEGRYDQPARDDKPAQTIHGHVHLEAHATIDNGKVDAGIDALDARTLQPLRASLVGKGGATIDNGAIAAHGLELGLRADGAELRKLAPDVKLRGAWSVTVKADGPADKLAVSVVAKPPAGRLAVDAQLKTVAGTPGQPPPSADAIAWTATVSARGIDPAAAVAGAPRGDVRLDASGKGKGPKGTVDLKGLVAQIAGTHVDAHGTVDTAGDAKVMANIASRDLTQLRTLGVKGVAGSLTARARVERTRTHLHLDADVSARQLQVRQNRVAKLDVHVHDQDFIGEAHVSGEGIRAAGLVLDTIKVDATGDPKAVQATIAARGPDKTSLDLVAHGTPTVQRHKGGVEGVKIVGADLVIEKLAMARYGQTWATTGPATVRIHDGVDLQKLELASGAQHLGLDARYDLKSGAIAASLRTQKLNIKELSRLAKPSLDLPDTELAIQAHVKGTKERPIADVSLDGFSVRSQRLGLNRIQYRLDAHYADERARAEWKLSAIDQSFHGKVDVPTVLTGNRPIMADLSASNIWMLKLRKVMPPALANIDGRLDGSIKASGTTQRPVVSVDIHGRGLSLGPDFKDNDVRVKLDYKERRANARAEVHLEQSMGKDAGALVAQVEVPIDAAAALQHSQRVVEQLEHKTPIAAAISLSHLDLARFPFVQLGMEPPVTAGMVDGAVRLRGTMHDPNLDVDVEAHGLKRGALDKIDVYAALDYDDKAAQLKLDASVRGQPLLNVRGQAPLDAQRVIDGEPYQSTPVRVDADVPGYDLARLADLVPKLAGRVNGKATVRGTIGHPTGKLDLAIASLNLGEMRYDKFQARGGFDGTKLTATLDAHEVKGGSLAANATVPVDAQKPVAVALRASGFYVDIENVNLTNPRLFKGTLNAQLDANGPRANPTVQGYLKLDKGQLALAADARIYEDVAVDVSIADGKVTLKNAQAKVADGSVKATGSATLVGLKPQVVDVQAVASKFPIPTGTFGAWVDATVKIHGEQTPEGMSGTIVVEKGTANLPKLAGGKKLQPTGPLEDVKFVDARARRAEARRKEAEKEAPTTELVARIPGPFHVRSKELSTDLAGNLQIAIAGPVMRLTGQVHTSGGWLELLGRRYNIEQARVGFGGEAEPDPELDVRLTRELSATRLIIEVHGTAKKPQLVLASDPPIYDQSQVIAAILSGDPATQRVDDRSLDQKVTGAVSGLLVGKIKDQIAPNLPIDVIKVDTGTEGATGLADTRVEVGKYITDTIYVSYVHQFGSTFVGTQRVNSNEADLEWRFKKHYELETGFGDAAVGRVNLYWTIRY